mmetsp:Transcript_20964/g.24254  ORF Transcript_20964/g.24254 Transcript_20964/m.24254 type:complete len:310 (-) Transcript_20964:108-1037(-)
MSFMDHQAHFLRAQMLCAEISNHRERKRQPLHPKKYVCHLQLAEVDGLVVDPLVRGDLEVQWSGALANTARGIVVATVAWAEEATEETLVGNRNATKVGANRNNDSEEAIVREASNIRLGVLHHIQGRLLALLQLAGATLVDVDGLATPHNRLALTVLQLANLSLDVHLPYHGHRGLSHVPNGENGIADHEDRKAEHDAVQGVIHNTSALRLLDRRLRLQNVLAEELLVPHASSVLLQRHTGCRLDQTLLGALRVRVENHLLSGVNRREGGVGVLGVAAILVGQLVVGRRLQELIGKAVHGLVLGDERR